MDTELSLELIKACLVMELEEKDLDCIEMILHPKTESFLEKSGKKLKDNIDRISAKIEETKQKQTDTVLDKYALAANEINIQIYEYKLNETKQEFGNVAKILNQIFIQKADIEQFPERNDEELRSEKAIKDGIGKCINNKKHKPTKDECSYKGYQIESIEAVLSLLKMYSCGRTAPELKYELEGFLSKWELTHRYNNEQLNEHNKVLDYFRCNTERNANEKCMKEFFKMVLLNIDSRSWCEKIPSKCFDLAQCKNLVTNDMFTVRECSGYQLTLECQQADQAFEECISNFLNWCQPVSLHCHDLLGMDMPVCYNLVLDYEYTL